MNWARARSLLMVFVGGAAVAVGVGMHDPGAGVAVAGVELVAAGLFLVDL